MTTYQYRCATDGVVDVRLPMGTAANRLPCPLCAREATRVFSSPQLSLGSRRVMEAIDRTEKSRDEPDVVSTLPSAGARRRQRMAGPNPALQRLPRP